MNNKKKSKEINDLSTLKAFITPELFPFLLEIYLKNGKTEEILMEDIEISRESYKALIIKNSQQPSLT